MPAFVWVEPSRRPRSAFALYGGPALTVAAFALAYFRRRRVPAGSEPEGVADIIMRAWRLAAIFDVLFVIVNVTRIMSSPH